MKTNHIQNSILVLALLFNSVLLNAQEKTVQEILNTTQQTMASYTNFSCDLAYNLYNTYTATNHALQYKGEVIKQDEIVYTKINKTIFLSDAKQQTHLKLNEKERAMIFIKSKTTDVEIQSPLEAIASYVNAFKNQSVQDKGTYWLCTLTSDMLTQLPYGKVELHISKESNLITKQVLYFLTRVPYTNAQGERVQGNPKLEITLSNYDDDINEKEKKSISFSTYIKDITTNPKPALAYSGYKFIQ